MSDRPLILPPLRRTAADAARFARVVHEGQVDKAGRPYYRHLIRVDICLQRLLERSDWTDEQYDEARQVASLHDVIEDRGYTVVSLRAEGFSFDVVRDIEDLSRNGPGKKANGPYRDFIGWIASCARLPAILVAIADKEDNLDPDRLALLPEDVQARLRKKYEPALVVLKEAAGRLGWKETGQ